MQQRALPSGNRAVSTTRRASRAETHDAPLAGFVRRWWALLFVGSLLGTAAGYVYGKLGPTSYQSAAFLQVRDDPASSRPAVDAEVAALGYAAAAVAPSILNHVSESLQADGLNIGLPDLLTMSQTNKLTVQPVKGSSAINISVTHDSANVAQAIADKVAAVLDNDTSVQAQADRAGRRQQVQDTIDRTRGVLQSAQLYQRDQDLQQRMQTQQTLLLQLQNTFQQALQQQVQIALLLRQQSTPPPQAPQPTAEQQRQLNSLSVSGSQALAAEMAMLKTEQDSAQQAIAALDTQIQQVRDQLNALPDPSASAQNSGAPPGTLDSLAKITSLQEQEAKLRDQLGQSQLLDRQIRDLQVQSNDLHNQLRNLQTQAQQTTITQQSQDQQRQLQLAQVQDQLNRELDHQSLIKAQVTTIVPSKGQTDLNNEQQVQLQAAQTGIADSKSRVDNLNAQLSQLAQPAPSSAASTATVQLLQKQIQDAQQASSATDKQLADAQRGQADLQTALGPNPSGTIESISGQILQLQQQQRDQDANDRQNLAQWNTLKQQELDLVRQRETARGQLVQVQREQQADIQRQVDLGQRDIQTQVSQLGPQTGQSDTALPLSLIDQAADLRTGLLGQISDQQQRVTTTIADLNRQLDEVHTAEATLPVKMDPAEAAVQVSVATQQLAQLSQEFAKLLAQDNQGGPLLRYGPAAPAIATGSQLRLLPIGAALGLLLAAGLAYLLGVARGSRARRPTQPAAPSPRLNGYPRSYALRRARLATSNNLSSTMVAGDGR